MDEGFYLIPPPLVHNYLDYTDFFILIRSEEVGKGVIAVITAMPVTTGTPLAAMAETVATPGMRLDQINPSKGAGSTSNLKRKRVIAVIAAILITAGTPLIATAEIVTTLGTRLDQIGLLKGAGNILGFKIRFCNDVIIIKELDDIDITVLNDKAAMLRITTLEVLQPVS